MKNGGWTVILNRVPEDDDDHEHAKNDRHYYFDRDFDEYEHGFGRARRNFWLGLRAIHSILSQSNKTQLRVSLGNEHGHGHGRRELANNLEHNEGHGHHHTHFAYYSTFSVSDADNNYELKLGERYDGDLIDVSRPMSGRVFSTRDQDLTDNDCPEQNKSGWWFDDEHCWSYGMCLTCKHRHYYNGQENRNHASNYDDYDYIQMAIKSFR